MDCHSDKKESEALGYIGVDAWATSGLAQLASTRNTSILLSGIMILVVVGVIFYAARSIIRPLVDLSASARSIAQGDLSQDIAHHSADEIGLLADSFRELKSYVEDARNAAEALGNGDLTVKVTPRSDRDALSRSIKNAIATQQKLIAETGKLTRAAVEGRLSVRGDTGQFKGSYKELVQGMNDTLDAVIGPVNEAAAALEKIAAKDLGARVQGDYKGDLAKLKDALNTAVQNKVSEVMAEIAAASDQQTQGVEQVNAAMEQMNQVTQQTAANAEESAGAAEELAGQAEEMKALVHSFQLSSNDRTSAHRGGPQRARRPAATPAPARASQGWAESSDAKPVSPPKDRRSRKEDPAMMIPFDDPQEGVLEEF